MYGVANRVTGLTVSDSPDAGKRRTTVFKFSDMPMALVDEAGVVAYASKKLYTMPVGVNIIHSTKVKLSLTRNAAGVNADFDGDFSVGTAAASNNATLTGTEVDVVASTATTQAVAGVGVATGPAPSAVIYQNGEAGAKDIYLNVLVDDADQDVTTTPTSLLVNGTIEMEWTIASVKAAP